MRFLSIGKNIALVSDAGTPLICDPGYLLIQRALKLNTRIIPIPGPSATLAALSVSGLPPYPYIFLGYLPKKQTKRLKELTKHKRQEVTYVAYEAGSRVEDTLKDISNVFGPDTKICIARELTKLHEEFIRGPIDSIDTSNLKGEITLVWLG